MARFESLISQLASGKFVVFSEPGAERVIYGDKPISTLEFVLYLSALKD